MVASPKRIPGPCALARIAGTDAKAVQMIADKIIGLSRTKGRLRLGRGP